MRIDFIFLVCAFKYTTFPLFITYIQIYMLFNISGQHNEIYIYLPREETSKPLQKFTFTPKLHAPMEDKVIHPIA